MSADIREPVILICERLGLYPADVRKLTLTPGRAFAEIYSRNDLGEKFLDDYGEPATDGLSFEVVRFPDGEAA